MTTEYLIIGNSVSGVNCIEGIRQIDKQGKITVISNEDVYNYSRPLISYYLAGKLKEEELSFKGKDFYTKNRVELLVDTNAEKVDVDRKIVTTDKKGPIEFNKLLISTGGKPFIPDITGYSEGMEGFFTFTKLDDAKNLSLYIERHNIKESVVLGGGLIGLKCAEGLIAREIKTFIVELADNLLSTTLDKTSSSIIQEALKNKTNCEVFTKDTVQQVKSCNGQLSEVLLRSGKKIKTHLLISAIGVRPNIDIIRGNRIYYNRGIEVDSHMQTNCKDIYAAGDVAEGMDSLLEKNTVIAIWPVAAKQGRVAGINMAGGNLIYDGMFPMNAVDIAGIPVVSFGITNPPDTPEYEVLQKTEDGFYKKIVLKNNIIIGCIFLGNIERSGIFSGIISDRINVSEFKTKLLNDDFGLLVLPKEYRKHLVVGDGIEV